ELDDEQREKKEPYKPCRPDRPKKVPEVHFENGGGKNKQLEGSRGRQHGGEHDRPKFVLIKGTLDFDKSFFGNPLTQEGLAPRVSDPIQDAAAHSRSRGSQQSIEPEKRVVFENVGSHKRIHRK